MKDSFDRDADNEYAYNATEHAYIYQNMRPDHISVWEWRVMFDEIEQYRDKSLAMADAKSMAMDMGCATIVEEFYRGMYRAMPADYKEKVAKHLTKYGMKRLEFMKWLVVNDKYPDIVEIYKDPKYQLVKSGCVVNHYINSVMRTHGHWKQEAKLRNEDPSESDLHSRSL